MSASFSFGAITQCDVTGPVGSLISGISAATAVTNGCANVDKSFTEWFVGGDAISGSGAVAPSTGNVDYLASGSVNTAGAANAVAGTIAMTFNSTFANGWNITSGVATDSSTISYVVQAHTGGSFGGAGTTYTTPANPSLSWAISGIQLSGIASIASAAGSTNAISVVETFCIGATTTVGCTAGNTGTITATLNKNDAGTATGFSSFSCVTGVGSCSAGNTAINFAGVFTQIAISDVFTLARDNTSSLFLASFSNSFVESLEAPEPASFLLLGTGLLGAGIWRFRKYKKA